MIETSCRSNPFAGLLCDATQLTDSPKIGTSGIFAPNNTIGPIQEMGGSVLIHKTSHGYNLTIKSKNENDAISSRKRSSIITWYSMVNLYWILHDLVLRSGGVPFRNHAILIHFPGRIPAKWWIPYSWMAYLLENPMKMDDLGKPPSRFSSKWDLMMGFHEKLDDGRVCLLMI